MLNNILNGYRPLIIKIGVILLLAFCFTFIVTPGIAEEKDTQTKPNYFEVPSKLVCGKTEDFVNGVKDTANEELFSVGESDDNKNHIVSFWLNQKTKTWTIAISDIKTPELICIIHTGKNLKFNVPSKFSI